MFYSVTQRICFHVVVDFTHIDVRCDTHSVIVYFRLVFLNGGNSLGAIDIGQPTSFV